jgi:hypothetical protein
VTSIGQIRLHLSHIVSMFSNGDFNAPMLIHDTNPPGVPTMMRLKSGIRYTVSDIENGAKIRIFTSSPETTDAVHAFLLFQIIDYQTGIAQRSVLRLSRKSSKGVFFLTSGCF